MYYRRNPKKRVEKVNVSDKEKAPKVKRKSSGVLSNIIIFLILLIGIVLMAYPSVSNWWNQAHQTRAIAGYSNSIENIDPEQLNKELERAVSYNKRLVDNPARFAPTEDESAEYNSILNLSNNGIMGYLEIPSIKVKLPIYHGTSENVLQVAVGHIEGSSLPVGGIGTHVVLSGHRGLPSATLFTHLDELEEGDIFKITVLGELLTYQIDQIEVVLPEDTSLLAIDPDRDFVTLVTCTPYGVNSHRMLVRGSRIENLPEEEKTIVQSAVDNTIEFAEMHYEWVAVIAVLLLILIFLVFLKHRGSRQVSPKKVQKKKVSKFEIADDEDEE